MNAPEHAVIVRISVFKTAIALGIVLGALHFCWSALVAIGQAQPVINFVFWMHFIRPAYVVESFELIRALVLLGVTASIGFLLGGLFAFMWNSLHRE